MKNKLSNIINNDEKVLHRIRRDSFFVVVDILVVIVLYMVLIEVLTYLEDAGALLNFRLFGGDISAFISVFIYVLGATTWLFLGYLFVRQYINFILVTNERLIISKFQKFFHPKVTFIDLKNIEATNTRSGSFWASLFNYGTLEVTTKEGNKIQFDKITNPILSQSKVLNAKKDIEQSPVATTIADSLYEVLEQPDTTIDSDGLQEVEEKNLEEKPFSSQTNTVEHIVIKDSFGQEQIFSIPLDQTVDMQAVKSVNTTKDKVILKGTNANTSKDQYIIRKTADSGTSDFSYEYSNYPDYIVEKVSSNEMADTAPSPLIQESYTGANDLATYNWAHPEIEVKYREDTHKALRAES